MSDLKRFAPYVRQKRKPPKGMRCDMSVVVDYSHKTPTIKRCKNAATVEFKGGPLKFETWVCEACAATLEDAPPHA